MEGGVCRRKRGRDRESVKKEGGRGRHRELHIEEMHVWQRSAAIT